VSPVPGDVPEALRPFADAAQFLIPGCSSLSFGTQEVERAQGTEGAPVLARVARCGSAFEAPKGVGVGRYQGIEVHDFGPGGLHLALVPVRGDPVSMIAGCQVWHLAEQTRPGYLLETWSASVDDRFFVWSHDRTLLERALARAGKLADLLRPFDAVQQLPPDAESVVCALPRQPEDRNSWWARPLPIEPTVSFFRPSPWRLVVLHRQPLPRQYEGTATNLGSPKMTREGEWMVTTTVQDFHEPEAQPTYRFLVADQLFGLLIFI
jgi:hypothetical protein